MPEDEAIDEQTATRWPEVWIRIPTEYIAESLEELGDYAVGEMFADEIDVEEIGVRLGRLGIVVLVVEADGSERELWSSDTVYASV
jgi:hypothetical protein